jgi:hypothetical protein
VCCGSPSVTVSSPQSPMVLVWCWYYVATLERKSVTTVLLWCRYGITMVLLWCYYGVTTVLLRCYYGITTVLLRCCYNVTVVLPMKMCILVTTGTPSAAHLMPIRGTGCSTVVLQCCSMGLRWCYNGVTIMLVFQWCFNCISIVSQ